MGGSGSKDIFLVWEGLDFTLLRLMAVSLAGREVEGGEMRPEVASPMLVPSLKTATLVSFAFLAN